MLKIVHLAVVLVVGVSAIESQENSLRSDRIFGGQNATVGQFPYQVSLRIHNATLHQCGGSIIGRRFILSAAHCTQKKFAIPENVIAVVGAHRISTGGTHHRVDRIINHPHHDPKIRVNDICVIRTVEQIIYSSLVAPIALPTTDVPVEGNVLASVSGWGRLEDPTGQGKYIEPDVLKWKNTITLNIEICRSRMDPETRSQIHPSALCTTNPLNVNFCTGDSGGALVSRSEPRMQLGIVSFNNFCRPGFPDVYTRVYPHLAFIRVAMQE